MLTTATGALVLALILVALTWFAFQRIRNTQLHGTRELECQGYDGHLPNHSFTEAVPFIWLTNKAKELGSRIDIRLASQRVITVNEIGLIKQVTSDPCFHGRPNTKYLEAYGLVAGGSLDEGQGLINNEGATYQELRKRSELLLRSIGVGQKPLDFEIHQEINCLLERLNKVAKTETAKFQCSSAMFVQPVFNVLWSLLAGKKVPQEDCSEVLNSIHGALTTAKSDRYFHYMTHRKEAKETPAYECQRKVENFIKTWVQLYQEHSDSEVPREPNFIDMWFKSAGKSPESTDQLVGVLKDLVIKCTEPVAATLAWTIYFLSQNQRAQASLQEEIDRVVGSNGIPSINDRPQMPYTIAVLMETLRKSSIFPVGLLRSTTSAVPDFNGHSIPATTPVIFNYYAAHHAVDKWTDPQTFNPDRFIQRPPDGGPIKLMRSESSIPFSLGKRSCIGELLAKEQLFLFITSVFHKFRFELCDPAAEVSEDWAGQEALFRVPPKIQLSCFSRF